MPVAQMATTATIVKIIATPQNYYSGIAFKSDGSELYKEVKEYNFEFVPKQTYEFLELYFNGYKLYKGEITLFRELKTKIKLEVCVGAG